MKISVPLYRTQWDLHAWVGVGASLALFVMFFCGVFALLRHDLEHWQLEQWQEPSALSAARGEALDWDALLAIALQEAGPAMGASVGLVPRDSGRVVEISVGEHSWRLELETGQRRPPPSPLAQELYRLHFLEPLPYGTQLAGLASVALLALTVSGLLVHLKDLPHRAWQFRPTSRLRLSAGDAHKVLGLFGLPFALLFGWSGALLGFWSWQTQGFAAAAFGGDEARVEALRGYPGVHRAASGQPARALPLGALVARAAAATGASGHPDYVGLELYGDEQAWVGVFWPTEGLHPRRWARLDAVTGELFASAEQASTPANEIEKILFDLHYAQYGGRIVQLCYAALSWAAAAVALTGTLVWLQRRDPARARPGHRLLERLTVGVSAGLALGCALALLLGLLWPGGPELQALYGAWLAGVLLALVPALSPRAALAATCALAAALYAGAFALGLLPSLAAAQPSGPLAVELLLLVLSLGCGAVAAATRR